MFSRAVRVCGCAQLGGGRQSRGEKKSRKAMQKLGMRTVPEDDFIHPKAPPGHPLGPHVLYRISRPTAA